MTKISAEVRAALRAAVVAGNGKSMDHLIGLFPEEAKRWILEAIAAGKGNRTRAAEHLAAAGVPGASHRQLLRWINRVPMWADVDALCEREGFEVQPGAPRGG